MQWPWQKIRALEEENQRLGQQIRRLEQESQESQEQIEALKKQVATLQKALEAALRAGKRQAAPFSRNKPKNPPQKPGRKAGQDYGRPCRRPIPKVIDRVVEVPPPACCARCGGGVQPTGEIDRQFQTEIPEPRVERIEFRIHLGTCQGCGKSARGRHAQQTSEATGAAASQWGPRAVALAIYLNKGLGLSYGKVVAVLRETFGLEVSRGGLSQALARAAQKATPTYEAVVEQMRASPSVTADETGWKIGGKLGWMWVFSTPQVTVYSIQPGRGLEQAAAVLGASFEGFLVRDGWKVYRGFEQAIHQTCLAHLLRRCQAMKEAGGDRASPFPRIIEDILQDALQLRDRRDQKVIGATGLSMARGKLEARMDRALAELYEEAADERLANHLGAERQALFTFLYCEGLEATNYRAEQAIRPMVVTRKVWGGNRTWRGAQTQSTLVTILQTRRQQHGAALPVLQKILCLRTPETIDLTLPDHVLLAQS